MQHLCTMSKAVKSTREQKKNQALDLFLNTDLSQKAICDIIDVSEKTFSAWKAVNNWDTLKSATLLTSGRIVKNLYEKALKLSEEDNLDADKMIKLAKSIESLSQRKTTLSQTLNVFKDFTAYAFTKNPELAKEINKLMQIYINDKVSS